MKKIAFVSDAVFPFNKGGKETRIHQLTSGLAKQGYDVTIYTMKWWDGADLIYKDGVKFQAICPLLPLYDGPRRSIKEGVVFGLSCFKLLTADFDYVDVDHMPFFPLFSMRVVCWLKRKKLVATWHEVWGKAYWQEYLGGWKATLAWWIEKLSVRMPDQVIAVSEMTAGRLKNGLGFTGKIEVIPNGVDFAEIAKLKPAAQKSDVIYAGRLLKHKNIDLLIASVDQLKKRFPQILLRIIGEGPDKERLQKLVAQKKLHNNVEFMPFQKDIINLYSFIKSSKIFVLPSSREGFGLVVLEANACGVPVITVDEPDNAARFLISPESGAVSSLSEQSLAKSIQTFLTKKRKVRTLASHDWSSITKLEVNVINQTLYEKKRS